MINYRFSIGLSKFKIAMKIKYCYILFKDEFKNNDYILLAKIKKEDACYFKINKILQKYVREHLLYYSLDDCFLYKKQSFQELTAFTMTKKGILSELSIKEESLKFYVNFKNYSAAQNEINEIETLRDVLILKENLHTNF